jgi:hypothetical protein
MRRQYERPGMVTAAGVLLIVYGSLMLLCSTCGAINVAFQGPEADVLAKDVPGMKIANIAHAVSNLIVGVGMITLGILVMQLNRAARIGAYVICLYEILSLVLHSVYNVIFVFPATERFVADQLRNNVQPPINLGAILKGSMWFNVVFTASFTLAFCVPIMVFLSTGPARAAFANPKSRPEPLPYEADDEEDDDDDHRPPPPPPLPGDTGFTDRHR